MTNALHTIKRVLDAPEEKRDLLMEQTDAELSAFFSKPQNAHVLNELAYSLVGMAWKDAMASDVTRQVIEVKTVGFNEPDYVEEDLRGLRAYWQGKGGDILSGTLRYSKSQMPREEMVAALDMHDDEIATSFWGSISDLQRQYREKLAQLPVQRLIYLIESALPHPSTVDGAAVTGTVAAASIAASDIDAILVNVRKFSKGNVSILGTDTALHYLADVGMDFSDAAKDELFRTGKIGVYKGANVVRVDQFEDFDGNFVMPDDELWFVGQNAGRLTYYGSAPKVAVIRRPSFYQRWETARDAGMLLHGAQQGRVGRLVLT